MDKQKNEDRQIGGNEQLFSSDFLDRVVEKVFFVGHIGPLVHTVKKIEFESVAVFLSPASETGLSVYIIVSILITHSRNCKLSLRTRLSSSGRQGLEISSSIPFYHAFCIYCSSE